MELINATRMVAGYNMGLESSGRELLVVVIKGTFVLPKPGEQVRLHDEQLPLIMADTFTGEPGFQQNHAKAFASAHIDQAEAFPQGASHNVVGLTPKIDDVRVLDGEAIVVGADHHDLRRPTA